MTAKIHFYLMHAHVCFIISYVLLCFATTTASSLGHQLVVAGGGAASTCIDKERQALLDFKASIEDPKDRLSTWVAEEGDCCEWYGVTCNNNTGHVTELDLSYIPDKGVLGGELSSSLLNLSYLNHLDLYDNSFFGTIPKFIGSMTQLTYLDLSWNEFTGHILEFIGNMTNLTYLDLSWNGFTGTIPDSIGTMKQLTILSLGSNGFAGTIPRSIGSLTKLTILSLGANNISGTIPKSIGSLTQLTQLEFDLNPLYGTIPPEFGNLTNLVKLSLRYLEGCTVENLNWLSSLSYLETLYLPGVSLVKANYWVNIILSLQNLSDLWLDECDLPQVMHPYSAVVNSSSTLLKVSLRYNNLNSSMYHWLFPLIGNRLEVLAIDGNKLDGKFSDFLNNLSRRASGTLHGLGAASNQYTGSLSDEIQKFSSLEYLTLSHNNLNGTLSGKVWELPRLQLLEIASNNFRVIDFSENIGKSKLQSVNFSNSSVEMINLSSCNLGPLFPKWIQTLIYLTSLNIANTSLSDTVPLEFWDMWPSQISYLNLSSNNISGKVPDLVSNFQTYSTIDLSSNSFSGPIPNVSSSLQVLNLSKNKFSGGIFFLCQINDGVLSFLDLSDNMFNGEIPNCLWHFKELTVLNLGNNNLSGMIPASVGSLIELEVLYLNNNDFYGELPLLLKNCTKLTLMDLEGNMFSGNVPIWIGENLSGLYALSLRSNKFFGTIPLQLCQLVNLHVLDMSMNKLKGTIPSCLNKITAMVQKGIASNEQVHDFMWGGRSIGERLWSQRNEYVDHLMIQWQGIGREFTSNLRFLKSIDISSNYLSGPIPNELLDLHQLVLLNLSRNTLQGKIPQLVDQLREIQILDLSRNKFSGGIPSSMSLMTYLNFLDVSYNNLSGKIPSSTQLQTFNSSSYIGNPGLCGPPLPKCPGNEELQGEDDDGEANDDLQRWFYIGGATGFPIGFWIICWALLLNGRGRCAFFSLPGSLKDWVYVKMLVFIAKLQTVAGA